MHALYQLLDLDAVFDGGRIQFLQLIRDQNVLDVPPQLLVIFKNMLERYRDLLTLKQNLHFVSHRASESLFDLF